MYCSVFVQLKINTFVCYLDLMLFLSKYFLNSKYSKSFWGEKICPLLLLLLLFLLHSHPRPGRSAAFMLTMTHSSFWMREDGLRMSLGCTPSVWTAAFLPSLDALPLKGERPQQWFMEPVRGCKSTTCGWHLVLHLTSHFIICHCLALRNTVSHKRTSKGCWADRVPPSPFLWWTQTGAIIPVTPSHWSPQDWLTEDTRSSVLVVKVDTVKSYQEDNSIQEVFDFSKSFWTLHCPLSVTENYGF